MIKLGIFGGTGRVGKLLIEESLNHQHFQLSAIYARRTLNTHCLDQTLITQDYQAFLQAVNIVIDFSSPESTKALLQNALHTPKPLVVGTTGLDSESFALLRQASKTMPILYATNMSRGVSVLNKLATIVASTLKESDIEICETHHRFKKDAPSGTALTLAEHCAKARNLDLDSIKVSGREGNIGERSKDEIALMSLRGGDIVGKHTIGFYLDGEYLELTHTATSRLTFAKGALDVALWLINQQNGLYDMNDALKL